MQQFYLNKKFSYTFYDCGHLTTLSMKKKKIALNVSHVQLGRIYTTCIYHQINEQYITTFKLFTRVLSIIS